MVYIDLPKITIGFIHWSAMVYNIIIIASLEMNQAVVTTAIGNFGILLQHLIDTFKWPHQLICNCVGHAIIWIRPATFRSHKVIFTIAEKHKRTFRSDFF